MAASPVVIIGTAGSGKSSLCIRFIADRFVEFYEPTLEDLYRKQVEVDGQICVMDIFDTAGTEGLHLARDAYIRQGHGFLILYAINDAKSFQEVQKLHDHVLRIKNDEEKVPFVLVGTKCDLENDRKITYEQGQEMGDSFGASFFEASSCDGINVNEVFVQLMREIRKLQAPLEKKSKEKEGSMQYSLNCVDSKLLNRRNCTINSGIVP